MPKAETRPGGVIDSNEFSSPHPLGEAPAILPHLLSTFPVVIGDRHSYVVDSVNSICRGTIQVLACLPVPGQHNIVITRSGRPCG